MSDDTPKYPHIEVELAGRDGNAFTVMAAVSRALKRNGVPRDKVNEYMDESMNGDYDNLLRTAMKWVTVL